MSIETRLHKQQTAFHILQRKKWSITTESGKSIRFGKLGCLACPIEHVIETTVEGKYAKFVSCSNKTVVCLISGSY